MNGPPFDIIAYTLLAGLGIVSLIFLAIQTKTWWDGRTDRAAISDRGFAKSRQSPAPEPQPPAPEQHPLKPESEPSPRRGSQERPRLQQLLNRGVELEQNVAGIGGLGAYAYLSTPATRSEDIDAWEADVEAALRKRPRDIGLFRYERPRSPLDALATASAFDSPLKRRLRPRLHQLETIINRIP